MGLAFDDWDLDYYTELFASRIGRNPTSVEAFDIAQSNSEHSRHWFFKGRLIIDGQRDAPITSMAVVRRPWTPIPPTASSRSRTTPAASGGIPSAPSCPRPRTGPPPRGRPRWSTTSSSPRRPTTSPRAWPPSPGAETGTGGRIRDVHATGRGSLVVAGTAAYCVGNLRIPGYPLPWEDSGFRVSRPTWPLPWKSRSRRPTGPRTTETSSGSR